jgi:hypothetical protein
MHLCCFEVKLPNLKLKTRPKQLLGFSPLDIIPTEKGEKRIQENLRIKLIIQLTSGVGTVVKQLAHHPQVKGLSPAKAAGTRREEMFI